MRSSIWVGTGHHHQQPDQADRGCGWEKAIVEYGPPDLADVRSNWADVTKAGELLGWEPQYNLRAGIEKLVEWYNAEREWASQIRTTKQGSGMQRVAVLARRVSSIPWLPAFLTAAGVLAYVLRALEIAREDILPGRRLVPL